MYKTHSVFSSQAALPGMMLIMPGLAIAASTSGMASFYGLIYGTAMAAIGYWLANHYHTLSLASLRRFALPALLIPGVAMAATSGTEFQAFYDFIYDAATGYLGRGLAITGGVFGLAYGIGKGSPLPAVLGIVLAIFGMLGPTIVNALFSSATI